MQGCEGFEPFAQGDYYKFEFSPGVFDPEPASIVLVGTDLPIVIGLRRRFRSDESASALTYALRQEKA